MGSINVNNQISGKLRSDPELQLRREVTVWGSFMWGYADVGANIYVALGLVLAAAQGAGSIAFALAGIVYIMIGLAYTELTSAYPIAGGGPYFTLRGLGDFWGIVSGSALLLAYTIDIALFSVASAGYINFFFPEIQKFLVSFGPFQNMNLIWCLESLIIIGFLIWLNIKGIRESTLFNNIIGIIDILSECTIVICGFVLAWKPEFFIDQLINQFPSSHNFFHGASLAIISFIGLESISQAAQETKRPATIIPRTSLVLIFTVFIFAVSFSTLALGILRWQEVAVREADPVALLASVIPYVGKIAGPFVAMLGATILLISANTGVMGASRLVYSLSQFNMVSTWFEKVHQKYRTPVRAIVIFSVLGAFFTVLAFLTPRVMDTLGNMYAFGATTGYILVLISLIKLRISDPYTPRPYKVPLNVPLKLKGKKIEIPVFGIIGILGVISVLFMVIFTHKIGRIAGPIWILLCFIYYVFYRKSNGYPVFKSIKRNWEKEQIDVLTSAEEFDLLEQYKIALAERDKIKAKKNIKNE